MITRQAHCGYNVPSLRGGIELTRLRIVLSFSVPSLRGGIEFSTEIVALSDMFPHNGEGVN